MAKNLFFDKKLNAVPVNYKSKSKDEREKRIQSQQFIKKQFSFSLNSPVLISNLEINIEILDRTTADTLNLHLFGISKKDMLEEGYREISYLLLSSSKYFTFMDTASQNYDFLVSYIAFTSNIGEVQISLSAQELTDEEKPRFHNENGV